jgi:hypothetical protein
MPQSGKHFDISITANKGASSQNVKFDDQHSTYCVDPSGEMDSTMMLQDSSDTDLSDFFKRPLLISTYAWGVGASLNQILDPWSAYFNNPKVVNRIANYKLLRAKLHVKVAINGNGFYYGRSMASYHPAAIPDFYATSPLVPNDAIIESQRPHVFLDPTTSTGGDMILPFYWRYNYMDIPRAEWSQMGEIIFRSLNPLKHANGSTDPITIRVYAWCEDISYTGLTRANPATIVPQSGTEVDEANAKGFISKPATAIASAAGKLKNVPVIGKYATATQTIAGATADVARNFGYCRPPQTENPQPGRLNPTSSLALTNVPDSVQKLTTDDKQELTIDPSIVNLPRVDSLNIRDIASKETFLTKFSWSEASASDLLWTCRVQPTLWAQTAGPPVNYWFPACAFAALPFEHWSGSMKFRFQVACSSFHKGRLRVVYDPTNVANENVMNVQYTHIVDLADMTDFTVTVPHAANRTLLPRTVPPIVDVSNIYGTAVLPEALSGNGVIGIFSEIPLTSPSGTIDNSVEINVYVSMGDDFEVYNPSNDFQRFGFMQQSGPEIVPDEFNTTEYNAPLQADSMLMGLHLQDNDYLPLVYMGESIKSFRTMLKRYNLHRRDMMSNGLDYFAYHGVRPQFPALRGVASESIDNTLAGGDYTYVNTILLHWVRMAFQGHRGSIRYKMMIHSPVSWSRHISGYIERRPFSASNSWSDIRLTYPANTSQSQVANLVMHNGPLDFIDGINGALYINSSVNPTAEFEVPWESDQRCYYARNSSFLNTSQFSTAQPGFKFALTGQSSDRDSLDWWVAAGEDFQCYFFVGLPRCFVYNAPPAPEV